jgi:hypothetical protein
MSDIKDSKKGGIIFILFMNVILFTIIGIIFGKYIGNTAMEIKGLFSEVNTSGHPLIGGIIGFFAGIISSILCGKFVWLLIAINEKLRQILEIRI